MKAKQLSVEEMSALYDRIYDIADRLIKKHNPCNILRIKDLLYCHDYTKKYGGSTQLCCACCKKHWSEKGCTVKALGCKLFLCYSTKNKILRRRFQRLRNYACKHLTFNYFDEKWKETYQLCIASKYYMSKEDWLKLLEKTYDRKDCRNNCTVATTG